jgi:hypothetical protein
MIALAGEPGSVPPVAQGPGRTPAADAVGGLGFPDVPRLVSSAYVAAVGVLTRRPLRPAAP